MHIKPEYGLTFTKNCTFSRVREMEELLFNRGDNFLCKLKNLKVNQLTFQQHQRHFHVFFKIVHTQIFIF